MSSTGAQLRVSFQAGDSNAPQRELQQNEVLQLLSCDDPRTRLLGVFILDDLVEQADRENPSEEALMTLTAFMEQGLLTLCYKLVAELSTQLGDGSGSVAKEFHLIARFLHRSCVNVITEAQRIAFHGHVVPDQNDFETLALAVRNSWVHASEQARAGISPSTALLEVCIWLVRSHRVMERLLERDQIGAGDSSWTRVDLLADPQFISSLMQLLSTQPQTEIARAAAYAMLMGSNYPEWNISWSGVEVNGVQMTLDAIASTSHDDSTLLNILGALGNAQSVMPVEFVRSWIDMQVLDFLQPTIFHSNPEVCLGSCCCISSLAVVPEFFELVERNGVLQEMADVLRTMLPGTVVDDACLTADDYAVFLQFLDEDSDDIVRICGLHYLGSVIVGEGVQAVRNREEICKDDRILDKLRECMRSTDAFVYLGAVHCLRVLGLPVAYYRAEADAVDERDKLPVSEWSIAQVASWVGQQPFGCYRSLFRKSLRSLKRWQVNGDVLLTISDEDLSQMHIDNCMHRRAIILGIRKLSSAQEHVHTQALSPASPSNSIPVPISGAVIDVFISYRRDGGSDFAQLLKICFKSAGINVFLDVDNLGAGKFDEKLWKSLAVSRNVLCVWTKGCMDRFLNGNDPCENDFVRKEWGLALKLSKHIVPVTHENFEFPSEEELPSDVQPILKMNAVPWIGAYREASFERLKNTLKL